MIRRIFSAFILFTTIISAQVNDNLNLFNEEDKKNLALKVEEILEKREVKVYINTLIDGEGFQLVQPEKSIVLNINKENPETQRVQINFTQDLNMEEKEEEIGLLLDNVEQFMKSQQYGTYTLETLNGLDEILQEQIVEEVQAEPTFPYEKIMIGIMIIFICLTIVKIIFKIKRMKKI